MLAQPHTVVAQGHTVVERRAAASVQSVVGTSAAVVAAAVGRLVNTVAAVAAVEAVVGRLGNKVVGTPVVAVAAAVGRRRVVGHSVAVVAPDRTVAHMGLDTADSWDPVFLPTHQHTHKHVLEKNHTGQTRRRSLNEKWAQSIALLCM
jgi:hypothetical protein